MRSSCTGVTSSSATPLTCRDRAGRPAHARGGPRGLRRDHRDLLPRGRHAHPPARLARPRTTSRRTQRPLDPADRAGAGHRPRRLLGRRGGRRGRRRRGVTGAGADVDPRLGRGAPRAPGSRRRHRADGGGDAPRAGVPARHVRRQRRPRRRTPLPARGLRPAPADAAHRGGRPQRHPRRRARPRGHGRGRGPDELGRPSHPRPWCIAAAISWVPMPRPCWSGRTAKEARIHISSRTRETAPPTTSPSTSATQQPPGSVTSARPVRRIQCALRPGGRRTGSGQARW